MITMREESIQRHGLVFVSIGGYTYDLRSLTKKWRLLSGVPNGLVAGHICLKRNELNPLEHTVLLSLGKEILLRLRIHPGGK